MELTIEVKENGQTVGIMLIEEERWILNASGTAEIVYENKNITIDERWGYLFNIWISRPTRDVREEHGGA